MLQWEQEQLFHALAFAVAAFAKAAFAVAAFAVAASHGTGKKAAMPHWSDQGLWPICEPSTLKRVFIKVNKYIRLDYI